MDNQCAVALQEECYFPECGDTAMLAAMENYALKNKSTRIPDYVAEEDGE